MKILVRLPNWLGDVVMSTAFVSALKQLYPEASIDVIIKKELAGIAAQIGDINKIHSFSKQEFKGLTGVYRFGKQLQTEHYDIFFTLPSSTSSAIIGWAAKAKQRVGFGEEGGIFLLTKRCKRPANLHRVDEYLSILEQFTGKTITQKQVKLTVPNPVKNDRVLINFNSEAESRRMPLDKGRHLINLLTNTYPDTTFTFIGSPKEGIFVSQLIIGAEHTNRLENYTGKTNLTELSDLMAGSKVILTTDSGPAHLANSVGAPTIVLFGAGNELNTAPYNIDNLTVLRYGKLECEPCVRNTCKLYGIPKCMQLLEDAKIIEALNLYLLHA